MNGIQFPLLNTQTSEKLTKIGLYFLHNSERDPISLMHNATASGSLTLKAPNKNCSRRHFNFLLLSFEENKA